jgi:hypothetical protein
MFRPINEFNDCNINIEISSSNLLNLKSELFGIKQQLEQLDTRIQIQQLEQLNIRIQLQQLEQFSLMKTFLQSSSHLLKQHLNKKKNILSKQILEEEKRILEYEIRKNNYIIYIASDIEIDSKKEPIFVPPRYPIKHIHI